MATGTSLLLADDSITIQKVINLTFADEGMNVTTVGNGDLALQKIEELAPDIVMLDVHMPGLNGYEICERLKQSDRFRDIPVILLVGSFEPFDEDEAKRVGADDFLTKPFQSIRQLITKVNGLLQDRPTEALSSHAPETDAADGGVLEYEVAPGQDLPGTNNAVGISSPSASSAAHAYDEPKTVIARTPEFAEDNAGMDDESIEARPITGQVTQHDTYAGGSRATRPLSAYEVEDLSFAAAGGVGAITMPSGMDTPAAEAAPAEEPVLELGEIDGHPAAIPPEERVLDLGESAAAFGETGFAAFDAASPVAADAVEPAVVSDQPVTMNFDPAADTASLEHQVTPTGPIVETAAPAGAPAVGNVSFSANDLSPETIEAIARRVVELMSDNAVREIAWEVVPQLADLHIKRKLDEQK